MKQNKILCCDTNLSKPRLINCHHTSSLRLMNLCSPQCTLGIIMVNGPGVSIAHLFESQWLSKKTLSKGRLMHEFSIPILFSWSPSALEISAKRQVQKEFDSYCRFNFISRTCHLTKNHAELP